MLRMILVILKHLKSYLEIFINRKMTRDEAELKQDEFNAVFSALSNYSPRDQKYFEAKNKLLNNVKNFYEGRKKIIEGFKNGIFLLNHDGLFKAEARHEEPLKKSTKTDLIELNELIIKKETSISRELFKDYFKFKMPTAMLKNLYNLNDEKKNNLLVNAIKSGLSNLENEIKKMSEDEIKIEKLYEIVDIVENILQLNRQNPEGQGLKILTPN